MRASLVGFALNPPSSARRWRVISEETSPARVALRSGSALPIHFRAWWADPTFREAPGSWLRMWGCLGFEPVLDLGTSRYPASEAGLLIPSILLSRHHAWLDAGANWPWGRNYVPCSVRSRCQVPGLTTPKDASAPDPATTKTRTLAVRSIQGLTSHCTDVLAEPRLSCEERTTSPRTTSWSWT